MSAVVYTRVPEALKQTLQARARERGLSLNAVVLELVERGLEPNSSDVLEEKLAVCASELERTQGRLAQAELGLQAAREREQETARTYGALAERARHELALCPQCRTPVRGSDLLVRGHCPNCNRPITALLIPRPQTGAPDRDAYLALLGALGALLGLALAASGDSAD